jgi:hypothetical protein
MDPRVRRWMTGFASEEQSVRDDVEPYLDASPEELDWAIDQACALAEELLRAQRHPQALLQAQDRRSPQSERLWLALVRKARRERSRL